jgi:hypothetical protein
MKQLGFAILVLLAVGCGKPVVQAPVETSVAPTPTLAPVHEVSHDETEFESLVSPVDPACPLYFPKAGLCAAVEWKKTPSADEPLELQVRFWVAGAGTRDAGPYVTPSVAPKAFFIMKCCKTPKACPLKAEQTGVYSASGITLITGEYWHYVQVGTEKASSDVVVP